MSVRLHLESLDEDEEVKEFSTTEEAIAYASWWFLAGYLEDPESLHWDQEMESIMKEAGRLVSTLTAGREFIGSFFYEKARIER